MQRAFACAAIALAAGLAACSSGNSASSTTTTTTTESSPAGGDTMAAAGGQNGAAASDGAKVYKTNCSSCHQENGQGAPGAFPPLANNPVVTGDPKTVVHILKYGLNGKIEVNGKSYNGQMPAWSPNLSDGDIASVITYIRSSWGNKASAVTATDVTAVSK